MTLPNLITCSRFLLSAALLFFPAFSPPFRALYAAAGLTDILDGFAARKTGTVSQTGARLDSAADLTLTAACLLRLLPALDIPVWLLAWAAGIALIRAVNIVSGFVMYRRFIALHTVMNKITGAALFVLPLTLPFIDLRYGGAAVCAAAIFAAVQEGHFIRTGREK